MTNEAEDIAFMHEAIQAAAARGTDPSSSPIGCVIVRDGKVLAVARNRVEDDSDPTAHAEIVAIRIACEKISCPDLRGATLYSTLQPCGMCTMASIWAKIGRVVYGAGRDDVHRMYFEDRHINTLDFVSDAYREDISIEGGILKNEFYFRPDDHPPKAEQGNI